MAGDGETPRERSMETSTCVDAGATTGWWTRGSGGARWAVSPRAAASSRSSSARSDASMRARVDASTAASWAASASSSASATRRAAFSSISKERRSAASARAFAAPTSNWPPAEEREADSRSSVRSIISAASSRLIIFAGLRDGERFTKCTGSPGRPERAIDRRRDWGRRARGAKCVNNRDDQHSLEPREHQLQELCWRAARRDFGKSDTHGSGIRCLNRR